MSTLLDKVIAEISTLESGLAKAGTSIAGVSSGVPTGLIDFKNAALNGVESAAISIAESIFPQVKTFIDAGKMLEQFINQMSALGIKGASPEQIEAMQGRSENPYSPGYEPPNE